MPTRLSKSVTLLLAILMGVVTSWQGLFALPAGGASASAPVACKCCCGSQKAKCCTSGCCAKPADDRAPFCPASPAPTSPDEWQALAASTALVLTWCPPAADDLPAPISSSSSVAAVPIFQRDCCYLL